MTMYRSEPSPAAGHRHRIVTGLAALGLVLVALIARPSPAFAHTDLDSATPVPNSVVATAVSEVVLNFSGPVVLFGDGVTVSNGPQVIRTSPSISGSTVTAKLATPIGAGSYDVTWNIKGNDGHEVTQSYSFSVAAGVVAPITAPGPLPETTATSAPEGASTTSTTAAADPTTTTTTPPKKKSSSTALPNWALYAIPAALLVGVAAAIGGLVRLVRKRSH